MEKYINIAKTLGWEDDTRYGYRALTFFAENGTEWVIPFDALEMADAIEDVPLGMYNEFDIDECVVDAHEGGLSIRQGLADAEEIMEALHTLGENWQAVTPEKQYTFYELGYFSGGEIERIKKVMDGRSFMDFRVLSSNEAGNHRLIVASKYGATESEVKGLFLHMALASLGR